MKKWEETALKNNWTPLSSDDDVVTESLEMCVITGHSYPGDFVSITYEGAVLTSLWGQVPVEFDDEGRAIMPPHVIELFKVVVGREPDLD